MTMFYLFLSWIIACGEYSGVTVKIKVYLVNELNLEVSVRYGITNPPPKLIV